MQIFESQTQPLQKKAIKGVFVLSFRRILTQLILSSSNIVLARILYPQDFGKFAVISLILSIFTITADVGLNAAIVQHRQEPSQNELKAIFTVQLVLAILAVGLVWLIAPLLTHFYKSMNREDIFMTQVSSFSILFFNLKLVSQGLLERELKFMQSTVADVLELLITNIIAIFFALQGFGFKSFIYGLLISRFLSAAIYYLFHPWQIGFRPNLNDLKTYLPFGAQFQINSIIGLLGGMTAPVIVGGVLGVSSLGLINWAGGVAALPKSIGEVVGRIVFPMCARSQNDKKFLKKIIEKALQLNNIISYPIVTLIISLAHPITFIIFTAKWVDGIGALYLFTLQAILLVPEIVITTALLALGHSKIVRNINLLYAALLWFLSIPLIKLWGIYGFALANLLASLVVLIALRELKKYVQITIAKYTFPYLFFAIGSGILTYVYSLVFPIRSLLELFLAGIFGCLFYGFLLFLFQRKEIKEDFLIAYHLFQRK